MSGPDGTRPFRRHRFPVSTSSTALLVVLSAIAAAVAVAGIVLAILLAGRLNDQVQRLDRVTAEQPASRRAAVLVICDEVERVKTDTRAVLRTFGITADKLPILKDRRGKTHRAFAPVVGGCVRHAAELVALPAERPAP